ncbi:hypothetical protein [Streptomyces sp. NPDC037389]|uniref:hypothetical protein n=1 Tax=Streptomyces sp. NPDC037389 TaxID=3155369 RepID=UPI0033ED1D0E
MAQAISLYERLGFVVPPPSCPAMPRRQGAAPEPFGAANTHADFTNSFFELATCVKDGDTARLPAGTGRAALGAAVVFRPRSLDRPCGSRHGGRR